MTRSPDELVTEFCTLWSSPDPDQIAGYFTEDAVYHNIPRAPMHGRDTIRHFIAEFLGTVNGIDFLVHRQINDGAVVMNERTDVIRRKDGEDVPVQVMG